MTTATLTASVPTAQHQTPVSADHIWHSGNARVIVERSARVRSGYGRRAREALLAAIVDLNTSFAGRGSAFVYQRVFGDPHEVHIILHLRSFEDYEMLLHAGEESEFRNELFGHLPSGAAHSIWDEMFTEGSVRDLVMQPHRWGMHGSLTEEMAKDPGVSPLVDEGGASARFDVAPAQDQTSIPAEQALHTANSGLVMRRTADFNYEFRAEARVFARAIAETVNLNAHGLATVFFYEEDFGPMDRVHWYIHLKSFGVYYMLMGLDARTDPEAPRASYIQDWISADKGGGSWERMLVQGSVQDIALVPIS